METASRSGRPGRFGPHIATNRPTSRWIRRKLAPSPKFEARDIDGRMREVRFWTNL